MQRYICLISYKTPAGNPGGMTTAIMARNQDMAIRLAKRKAAKLGRTITKVTAARWP